MQSTYPLGIVWCTRMIFSIIASTGW
jgi:hypothetical protein